MDDMHAALSAVTSALIGASSVKQLEDKVLAALNNLNLSEEELNQIESILKDG